MQNSLKERVIHALGFESIAILICAPALGFIFDKPIKSAGLLTLALSFVAMTWNMVYNHLVDRLIDIERSNWTFKIRVIHGLAFEIGIIAFCLPLAAWILNITFWQALFMEAGFFLFILPYTISYNWAFDKLKAKFLQNSFYANKNTHPAN